MFGLLPCFWKIPVPRSSLPRQRTLRISAPTPKPVKILRKAEIPQCELCIGENNDFSEIDLMLQELNDDSSEGKTRKILRTIEMVTENIDKNIRVIENAPTLENDNVSRQDILKLLRLFLNFTRNVENHIRETQCCY